MATPVHNVTNDFNMRISLVKTKLKEIYTFVKKKIAFISVSE